MDFKIVIPSRKRSDKIGKTINFTGRKHSLIYVNEDEVDTYKSQYGDIVRSIPDNIFGMGAIRKYMLDDTKKNNELVVQLDDDIIGLDYIFADKAEQVTDSDHFHEVLLNSYQVCDDLEIPVFGYTSHVNAIRTYTQLDVAKFTHLISMCTGILTKYLGSINYDPRFVIYEDHDFILNTKFYKRFVFVDTRYNCVFKKNWTSGGGASLIRNTESLDKHRELLQRKYGSAIRSAPKKQDKHVITLDF